MAATPAEVRAIRVPAIPTGPVLFAAWAIGATIIGIVRPGQLLEFATIGIAGAIAWRTLLSGLGKGDLLIGATCFLLPLLNTWPLRIYQIAPDRMPAPLPALFSASSLAAIVLLFTFPPKRWRAFPKLVVAAAGAALLGGLVAASLSGVGGAAFATYWSQIAVPIAIAAAIASSVHSPEAAWRVMALFALGALAPSTVAVGAYVLSFGIPRTGDDLVAAKMLLFRPHLLQEATLGNVGHLADLALLVMPAALLGATRQSSPRMLRAALLVAGMGSVFLVVITVSRSALFVGVVVALGLVVALALRGSLRDAATPFVALAILLAVSVSPPIRSSLVELVPTVTLAVPGTGASTNPASDSTGGTFGSSTTVGPVVVASGEDSEVQRIEAVRTGVIVFAQHMPFGVGPGRYEAYDPTHTASHSLFVEVLAEDGVLGALAITLLALFVIRTAIHLVITRDRSDTSYMVRVAATAGAGGFVLHGLFAGAPLAMGVVDVWATLLWLQVGISGAPGLAGHGH